MRIITPVFADNNGFIDYLEILSPGPFPLGIIEREGGHKKGGGFAFLYLKSKPAFILAIWLALPKMETLSKVQL